MISSLRESYTDAQQISEQEQTVKKHELPIFDESIYILKPSLTRLSMMTVKELKNVS
jgi:hypothetical protein